MGITVWSVPIKGRGENTLVMECRQSSSTESVNSVGLEEGNEVAVACATLHSEYLGLNELVHVSVSLHDLPPKGGGCTGSMNGHFRSGKQPPPDFACKVTFGAWK